MRDVFAIILAFFSVLGIIYVVTAAAGWLAGREDGCVFVCILPEGESIADPERFSATMVLTGTDAQNRRILALLAAHCSDKIYVKYGKNGWTENSH